MTVVGDLTQLEKLQLANNLLVREQRLAERLYSDIYSPCDWWRDSILTSTRLVIGRGSPILTSTRLVIGGETLF